MPKRRRRPHPHSRPRPHVRFDQLVKQTLASIPSPFRECLSKVAIVIDDKPTPNQLAENDLDPNNTLYKLYESIPKTEYNTDQLVAPNQITLFHLPLEKNFPNPNDLADKVRITVIHKLAHHLNINDDHLKKLKVD